MIQSRPEFEATISSIAAMTNSWLIRMGGVRMLDDYLTWSTLNQSFNYLTRVSQISAPCWRLYTLVVVASFYCRSVNTLKTAIVSDKGLNN